MKFNILLLATCVMVSSAFSNEAGSCIAPDHGIVGSQLSPSPGPFRITLLTLSPGRVQLTLGGGGVFRGYLFTNDAGLRFEGCSGFCQFKHDCGGSFQAVTHASNVERSVASAAIRCGGVTRDVNVTVLVVTEFEEMYHSIQVAVPCGAGRTPPVLPEPPTEVLNECPAEGYFKYPAMSMGTSALIFAFFHFSGQGTDVYEFCNAACGSRSDCELFEVETDTNICRISRGAFDESLLAKNPNFFAGVPCCPVQGYVIYNRNAIRSDDLLLDIFYLGQEEGGDNCNAECSSRQKCGFFHVEDNHCVMFTGTFHQSLLSSDAAVFVGVPCCPVQGYVIYSRNAIRRFDLILDIFELGQEEGGDNCNAECNLRRECGFFHVEGNHCVMFRGTFHQSLLSNDAAVFVGVPCGIENPTEDPSEAPTESPTEVSTGTPTRAPTLAPTRPTAGPDDCPAEGFFTYPTSSVGRTELVFAFYSLSEQDVDVDGFCKAACRSYSACEFFQISPGLNTCTIFRVPFYEFWLSSDSNTFVGVPCCPVQGYVIYSGNAIRSPDLILHIVELRQEEPEAGGDICNAECSLRRECRYFHVADNNCVMFRGLFHQGLLSSDAAVFVGVPCPN